MADQSTQEREHVLRWADPATLVQPLRAMSGIEFFRAGYEANWTFRPLQASFSFASSKWKKGKWLVSSPRRSFTTIPSALFMAASSRRLLTR